MFIISPIVRLVLKIATIILYILTAFCCFGGAVSPEIFPLGSMAVIGMPVMLTASAVVTIAWFCFGHWIVGAIGVLMFALCLSPIKMWFPMNSPTEPEPEAPVLTILTWNILHGADLEQPDSKDARTLRKILEVDADVVCLQEIFAFSDRCLSHYSQELVDSLYAKYPYQLGDGTWDLRILSRYPLRHIYFGSLNSFTLSEYFTVKTPTREIAMANVHLPSFALDENEKGIFSVPKTGGAKEKEKLGLRILHKMEYAFPIRAEAAQKVLTGFEGLAMPTIVCGDFNDVPASWTYRLFLKAGFQDAYVATNFFPTYTFYPHLFYFHLDQIFYRGAVRPLSVERVDMHTSDHLGLVAKFQILQGY
ncbi:MAG: endonuclease/exonuclease/phosphatase family protein [Muribaculaceae bacterium]|nr:endonuclease/exonuclease/phosphatase family protein [Muribaculaceae bacterium]